MTANADQINFWNEVVAAQWVRNQEKLDRLMTPLTDVLMQIAVPVKGEYVLDIGCGCGELEPRLAAAVGSGGRVRAIDVSKPMLARAKERLEEAKSEGLAPVEWLEADAMIQAFEPDDDLVISRFGVMFFDDRRRGFKNLRSALKPGGRFAFMTWRGRDEAEWFRKPLEWIERVLPMPENSDGEIGPFAFADGEATREQLADAGFWDVIADPIDRILTIGESVDEAYALLLDTGPAARLMRDADPAPREKAQRLLRGALEREAKDGRIEMQSSCWIYRGRAG